MRLRCVRGTCFGLLVVPLVCRSNATSSGSAGSNARRALDPRSTGPSATSMISVAGSDRLARGADLTLGKQQEAWLQVVEVERILVVLVRGVERSGAGAQARLSRRAAVRGSDRRDDERHAIAASHPAGPPASRPARVDSRTQFIEDDDLPGLADDQAATAGITPLERRAEIVVGVSRAPGSHHGAEAYHPRHGLPAPHRGRCGPPRGRGLRPRRHRCGAREARGAVRGRRRPVSAVQNLEERLAIAAEGADYDAENPAVSVANAVVLYLGSQVARRASIVTRTS